MTEGRGGVGVTKGNGGVSVTKGHWGGRGDKGDTKGDGVTKGRRDPGGGVQGDKGTWGALGCQRDMRGWGCQRDPGGSGCQRDVGGVGVPKGPGGFGVPCALKAPCSCRKTWVGARPCSSPRYPPNPPPSCSSAGSASLFHTVTTICDSTDVTPGRVCPPPPTKPRGLGGALGVGGGGGSRTPRLPPKCCFGS